MTQKNFEALVADECYNPDHIYECKAVRERLFPSYIDGLTKSVVTLHFLEEYTYKETAEILGMTEGEVRKLIASYLYIMRTRSGKKINMRKYETNEIAEAKKKLKWILKNKEKLPVVDTLSKIAKLKKLINRKREETE